MEASKVKSTKEAPASDKRNKDREKYVAAVDSEMEALRADLLSLIMEFSAAQTINYVDFVNVWQNTHMPEMIVMATSQRPNRELRLIMEEALDHAAGIFSESSGNQTKHYGAFYLMYALYVVQPTIPKLKIRLTFDMWQQVKALIEEAISTEQWDAVFIGSKMMEADAFHFVVTLHPLISERSIQNRRNKASNSKNQALSSGAPASPSTKEKNVPSIDALLQRLSRDTEEFELAQADYMQAKQALGTLRLPGLDRADSGVANEILAKIRRLAQP